MASAFGFSSYFTWAAHATAAIVDGTAVAFALAKAREDKLSVLRALFNKMESARFECRRWWTEARSLVLRLRSWLGFP